MAGRRRFLRRLRVHQPIYAYEHTATARGGAIASVVVYTGETFGDSYQNKVFIADYALGWIKELTFDPEYTSFIGERMFDDQAGTTVKLVQGPDGNLYQLTIYPGELSRIAPSGVNVAPTAVITATPNNGLAPLAVNFSSDGSNDTETPNLNYAWNFGDGKTSTEANPTHTYSTNGDYNVTLTVTDEGGKTGQATQRIFVGSTAPTIQNIAVSDTMYSAGDTITFSGTATDAENDPLDYKWTVEFHHDEHKHPFQDNIIGPSGSIVIPRSPDNIPTTWYRITLTVTDSNGLSTSSYVDVKPRTTMLTFNASNSEATFTLDGKPYTGVPFRTGCCRCRTGDRCSLTAIRQRWGAGIRQVVRRWRANPHDSHTRHQHHLHGDIRLQSHRDHRSLGDR